MVTAFEEFLLPVESFSFKKVSGGDTYISNDGYFNVFSVIHKNYKRAWFWRPTKNLLALVEDKDFVLKVSKNKSFLSRNKARDYCLQFISQILPELVVAKDMKQLYLSSYNVISQNKHSAIQIYRTEKNKKWVVKFTSSQSSFSLEQITSLEPITSLESSLFDEFRTRQDLIEALHVFVGKHLYFLYKNNSLKYSGMREKLLQGEEKFYLWWMSFIPLEINLEKVFTDI